MIRSRVGTSLIAVLILVCAGSHGRAAAPAPGAEQPDDSVAIVINIAAFRLELLEDGQVKNRYPIATGQRRYPTPTGVFTIARAEVNPAWTPPESDWAADSRPTPPGPRNPMGRAKLMFLPLYYIHGTPDSGSLGRAGSHGCIRMSNTDVLEVTAGLIRAAYPGATDDSLDALLADDGRTRVVVFERPVPVEIHYRPIEVVGDSVLVHRDTYRLWSDSLETDTRARLHAAVRPRVLAPRAMARLQERMRALPPGTSLAIPLDSIASR